MAKGQRKSNKEVRKPKKPVVAKPSEATPSNQKILPNLFKS